MIPINRTFAPLQALVDELRRCGVRHAVTSPGSRNAPLALVLAAQPGIETTSVLDERAAGFMALGMAKATRRPVAITCTSGTAAANLLPAVIEASEASVPLIVLTADRPPELRGVGAGQAIDQIGIFGTAAKWFVDVGQHDPGRATAIHHRALACRAHATAAGGRPGPVHLNVALREPLDPRPEKLDPDDWTGRAQGAPWVDVREHPPVPNGDDVQELAERIAATPRGAIVCGATGEPGLAAAATRLAAICGWPLLADPTSNLRCGEHDHSHVVAGYDVLLGDQRFAAAHRPELVLRAGNTPTSKPLRTWLAGTTQVVADPHGAWHEPTRAAALQLRAAAVPAFDALASTLEARQSELDRGWLAGWLSADALIAPAVAAAPAGSEPRVYTAAAGALPPDALVWVASSMPIRDVESYWPQGTERVRFLSNRGANGIDGTIASAAGAALATGAPCLVLTGELALAHDVGGLLAARRAGVELTIVCVNNGGGGIFDFLPVAASGQREAYERHVATPSDIDLQAVAALGGLPHRQAADDAGVRDAIAGGPGIVEVRTRRSDNVEVHRAIAQRVAAGLRG